MMKNFQILFKINIRNYTYNILIDKLKQQNILTGKLRNIRRIKSKIDRIQIIMN